MTNQSGNYDDLLKEDGPAAIVLKQWLKPVGGSVIFPPTYANPSQRKGDPPVYNIDRFEDSKHSVCVIDSIPSQANRIEPMLGRLVDKEGKPIKLVPRVVVKATVSGEEKEVDLLDAGHRAADAVIQFSTLRDEIAKAIKSLKAGNSEPLANLAHISAIRHVGFARERGEGASNLQLHHSRL